ncbi:unnamed protein product, partial [Iphiclides podalirius]
MSLKIALLCLALVFVASDAARGCPCPRIYWPVCGSDGLTYSNLQCMKCTRPELRVVKNGPCEVKIEATSPTAT